MTLKNWLAKKLFKIVEFTEVKYQSVLDADSVLEQVADMLEKIKNQKEDYNENIMEIEKEKRLLEEKENQMLNRLSRLTSLENKLEELV